MPHEEPYEAGFEDTPGGARDISRIQRLIGYQPVLDLSEMPEGTEGSAYDDLSRRLSAPTRD